jgi:pimeloyl-ACP methyl ester carboxylesterase
MAKARMNDLVVLLPGITGSVLHRDGRDVWNISKGAIWTALTSLGGSIKDLRLDAEDPKSESPVAWDGVRATALIEGAHLVPGLWKIDGYSQVLKTLKLAFHLAECRAYDEEVGNLIQFPYDWRRDVRISARLLKQMVDRKLALWRAASKDGQARVVLVAHSMGGLVAQYYLECLGGWRDARALITFGTPFRGSVQAVNYLVNGYKVRKLGLTLLDLTRTMQSFPSVHQLLPRYAMVEDDGRMKKVADVASTLGLDPALLKASAELHAELDRAAEENANDLEYSRDGYFTIPVVGTHQPTLQSARRAAAGWVVSEEPFQGLVAPLADGDGTVPRVSAIPISQSDPKDFQGYFVAEQHGALQNHEFVLGDLTARLLQLQVGNKVGAFRGAVPPKPPKPLSLSVDDLFVPGEPVVVRARAGVDDGGPPRLQARVTPVSGGPTIPHSLVAGGGGWSEATLAGVAPGLYRVEVRAVGSVAYRPVHGLFEVAPPEEQP